MGCAVKFVHSQKNCCASVEVSAEMLAVFLLAKRSLDVERHVTKGKLALVVVERKLQVASSATLSAQNSALAKAEKMRKFDAELIDVEEQLRVPQIASNKAHDDAKTAKE